MADKSITKKKEVACPVCHFRQDLRWVLLYLERFVAKKKKHGESVKLIRDSFVGIRSRADIQSQHAGAGNIMPRPGGGGFLLEQGPPPAQGGMHYK